MCSYLKTGKSHLGFSKTIIDADQGVICLVLCDFSVLLLYTAMLVRFELIFMCGIWIWTFFSVELFGLLKQRDEQHWARKGRCLELNLFYFTFVLFCCFKNLHPWIKLSVVLKPICCATHGLFLSLSTTFVQLHPCPNLRLFLSFTHFTIFAPSLPLFTFFCGFNDSRAPVTLTITHSLLFTFPSSIFSLFK